MGSSFDKEDALTAANSRSYKLVSATYRDKTYSDGTLLINEERSEIELRQWTGKKKQEQAPIARFRLEPTVDVLVDGSLVKVSELSISLESPARAAEVAYILRRPVREREAAESLSKAEAAVTEFIVAREQALTFLARMNVNPREALLGAESLWAVDDKEDPIDAVYSSYSARLADSLEKMTSALAGAETKIGHSVVERLYALAYTIGAVQNALFEGDFKQDQELMALQELGVATTVQDLHIEKPTERLLPRAHAVLAGLAAPQAPPE